MLRELALFCSHVQMWSWSTSLNHWTCYLKKRSWSSCPGWSSDTLHPERSPTSWASHHISVSQVYNLLNWVNKEQIWVWILILKTNLSEHCNSRLCAYSVLQCQSSILSMFSKAPFTIQALLLNFYIFFLHYIHFYTVYIISFYMMPVHELSHMHNRTTAKTSNVYMHLWSVVHLKPVHFWTNNYEDEPNEPFMCCSRSYYKTDPSHMNK